jgi:peroxiredoxin
MARQKRFYHYSSSVFISTLFIGLVLICVSQPILGEIILPKDRLTWGETIRVVVIPKNESGLMPGDHAYLYLFFWRQGLTFTQYDPLKWDGKQFACELTLPEGWEYGRAWIVTTEKLISGFQMLKALNREGQIPPGAKVLDIYDSRPTDWAAVAEAELSRYPELWWMNPVVWSIHIMESGLTVPTDLIRKHIAGMEKAEESAQLLRVMMQGYWDLDEVEKAFQMLVRLCEKYPNSPDTAFALYQAATNITKKSLPQEFEDKHEELIVQVVNSAPGNPGLREIPSFSHWLFNHKRIQLDAYRQLFDKWVLVDEKSPYPYILMAKALYEEGIESVRAEELVRRGLNLLLSERPYNHRDRVFPGRAYRLLSDLCARRGDLAGALANIRAAQIYTLEYEPTDLEKEARIWLQESRYLKAEEIALEAYRKGSLVAESFVKDLYKRRNGSDKNAEEYFWNRLTGDKQQEKPGDDNLAPEFEVTDIDGNLINSEKLRGKVVVLNFWFTGCSPCIGEMPELNKLVDDFSGDVRFLAFTYNSEDQVNKFLASHEFKYEIVANESQLKKLLGLRGHPAHIVIDQSGKIRWTGHGANPENLQRLRGMVERLLAEPK